VTWSLIGSKVLRVPLGAKIIIKSVAGCMGFFSYFSASPWSLVLHCYHMIHLSLTKFFFALVKSKPAVNL
jgi:hypothetical protein